MKAYPRSRWPRRYARWSARSPASPDAALERIRAQSTTPNRTSRLALAAVALIGIPGCQPAHSPKEVDWSIRSEPIGEFNDQCISSTLRIHPNNQSYAIVADLGGVLRVSSGGNAASFQEVDTQSLTFTRTGALIFRARHEGRSFVVHNFRESEPYSVTGPLVASPASDSFAYHAKKSDGRVYAISDTHSLGPFEDVAIPAPVLDPSGSRMLTIALEDGKVYAVTKSSTNGPWDRVLSQPVFKPDGTDFSFVAASGSSRFVVTASGQGEVCDAILESTPIFGPGRGLLAFGFKRGDAWYASVDGRRFGPYHRLLDGPFIFNPSGERFAFRAERAGKGVLVVDGQEIGEFDDIGIDHPQFSPDGNHWACAVKQNDQWFMLHDGKQSPAYDIFAESTFRFSPDSRRLGYGVGRGGTWYAVLDGKESLPCDGFLAGSPAFSPDSRRVAWLIRRAGKSIAVIDGRESEAYTAIGDVGLAFSPDSRRTAFWASQGTSTGHAVIDGIPGPAYQGIFSTGFTFSRDSSHVAYLAHTGSNVVLQINHHERSRFDISLRGSRIATTEDNGFQILAIRGNVLFSETLRPASGP